MKKQNATFYLAASIFLITFAVYLPSLRNEFIEWDDNKYIFENPHLGALSPAFFKWAFSGFYEANWHPLTWMSHGLDYAVWGLNPLGHHLTNIVLHSLNAFLATVLIIRLINAWKERTETTGTPEFPRERAILIAGAVAGLLFGIHPLHVESAAWVAERKDLLCALFFLLSVLTYTGYVRVADMAKTRIKADSRFLYKPYLCTLVFFMLALLSKPMAVSLPVVLLILDWHPFARIQSFRSFREAFVEKLPFFALSLLSSILTVLAQRAGGAIQSSEFFPFSTRLPVAANSLIAYMGKMVLPLNLKPYYPYPQDISFFSFKYLSALALVIGITVICAVMANKQKLWPAAWGYYLITLVPVLGLVQVGGQAMADRYTYLPSLGPFLIMGLAAAWSWEKVNALNKRGLVVKPLGAVMAVLVFGALASLTLKQIGIWKNSIVFWTYAIENEQGSAPLMYYFGRGNSFYKMGRFDEAIKDYDAALALNPSYGEAYYGRGIVFYKMGQMDRAIQEFDKAIDLDPFPQERYYYNRGHVLHKSGQPEKAIKDFEKAIALNPSYDSAYHNRGLVFYEMGRPDKALQDLDMAIALNPSDPVAYNSRGLVLEDLGQNEKAIADYDKAIALKPSYYEAYDNAGTLFGKAGMFDKAVEYFTKSIAIDPTRADAYYNRGFAGVLSGRHESALEDFNKAILSNRSHAPAYLNRGALYLKMGDKERARADFRKACALGSEDGCNALRQ